MIPDRSRALIGRLPMTLSRRIRQVFFGLLAVTAVAAGSVAAVGVTASSPAFAAEGSCADGSVVVVDSTDLGGTLEVRCAVGSQESGDAYVVATIETLINEPGMLDDVVDVGHVLAACRAAAAHRRQGAAGTAPPPGRAEAGRDE